MNRASQGEENTMPQYYIWERAIYKGDTISADNLYRAVEKFAGAPVLNLSSTQYLACGTSKSNPGRFITSDGSAREFTAYEIPQAHHDWSK
jgi:hypothetical protein